MERYKTLKEKKPEIPEWLDEKISACLEQLRDGNFGNAEGRQNFLQLITQLFNSRDKRARRCFKMISKLFNELGDELLTYGYITENKIKEGKLNISQTLAYEVLYSNYGENFVKIYNTFIKDFNSIFRKSWNNLNLRDIAMRRHFKNLIQDSIEDILEI